MSLDNRMSHRLSWKVAPKLIDWDWAVLWADLLDTGIPKATLAKHIRQDKTLQY